MPSAWNVLLLELKLVSSGKLEVAPARAYRLAAETVVAPLAVRLTPEPVAVREPPVIARGPLSVEVPAVTVNDPPVTDSVSFVLVVTLWTDRESPAWMTMVAAFAVLMTTSSPLVGTCPVLQLLPTSQSPPARSSS